MMSLAYSDGLENTLTWLGVGNIGGILLCGGRLEEEAPERLFLHPGVMGCRGDAGLVLATARSINWIVCVNSCLTSATSAS